MKKSLLLLLALIITGLSYGQLTGIKTIPGAYATVALAIADLNAQGVGAGGVTFSVIAGHTETLSSVTAGLITATGTAANPIVFQKSGAGANPLVTAGTPGTGTMDNIFCFLGTDYITFDGIDIQENAANTTTTQQMERGYAVLKASATDGSQHVTIKNCAISLNKANTATYGIYSNNITNISTTALTVTALSGTNSYNKFYSNTFTNVYNGIYLYGYAAASPYDYYDQGNEIGKDGANTLTSYGGGTATSYGIYGYYQNDLTIANTSFLGTITSTSGACYGMYLGTMVNSSLDIYSNTITLTYNGTGSFYGIYCLSGASGTSNTTNIYNNSVTGCSLPNATSGTFYGLYMYGGMFSNFYNNSVTNNSYGGGTTTATGSMYGIYHYCSPSSPGVMNVYGNTVSGNSRNQSVIGTGTGYHFYMSGGNGTMSCYDNIVDNQTIGSTSTQYICYILYSGAKNFHDNTISNILNSNGGTLYSLYNGNGAGDALFYNNKWQNINGNGTTSLVYGIYQSSGANVYYFNNFISELNAPAATGNPAVYGAYLSGGTNIGMYNNTIYLNASSTGASFGATGIYASTTPTVELRNNIVVNNSTPGATGRVVAYQRSTTTLTTYAGTSNNNNWWAGTPGASNLIFWDGTNADQTLGDFKARVSPSDASSVSAMPPFINVATNPYDLHINTTVLTQMESGGATVSTPVNITTDYDNNPRYPNPGYPSNPLSPPTAPDIGADEFAGRLLDLTPPNISYTPFLNTSSTIQRTLTTTITDATGVPTAGTGLPRLYWRINSGAWQSSTAAAPVGDQYQFTFGGGVVLGDVVSYYIVAQDMVTPTPNIGASPSGGASGFTSSPPACSTPPTTPESYTIVGALCGTYSVGVGQTYTTLTAAIDDLNLKEVTCDVVFELWDATYSASETFPFIIYQFATNNPANTVTIKPKAGVTSTVTGTPATGILVLYGVDNVILNGSNSNGSDKSLTWENSNTAANTYVIGVFNNAGDPASNCTIKNCIVKASSQVTNTTYAVILNAAGGGYDNIIIDNNTIMSARYGMQVAGVSGNPCTNVQVTNNIIGSSTDAEAIQYRGILTSYADNTLISGNDIMGAYAGNSNYSQAGLYVSTASTNTKIRKNKIHDWYYNGTGGWGNYGLYYTSDATSVTEISNNLIYNIKTDGYSLSVSTLNPYGIWLNAGGNIQLYFNTIYLSGNVLSSSYNCWSACIGISSSVSLLDIQNNILKNSLQPVSGTPASKTYAIITSGSAAQFSTINYNDYFVDGIGPNIGYMASDRTTLLNWQAATTQDANSVNLDPNFVSGTDLTPTNVALDNLGIYMPAITTDFNNTTRTNPPDMGAIEFGINPAVITTAASVISSTTATLNGTINANTLIVNSFFDWGLTTAYGSSGAGTPASVTGTATTPVNRAITGLTALTTYHYRARGVTSGGVTVYGNDMTFTTTAPPPTVVTTAASSITSTGATLNGTVNANGASTVVTFDYGLTTGYGSTATATQSPVTGSTVTPVSAPITGLAPNTLYHYRVKGVNAGGTSNGLDMTFTTSAAPPVVVTNFATAIGATFATLNGTVTALNSSTTVTFQWGLTPAFGNVATATPSPVTGNTATPVSANITGLTPATTYYFRCVGVNGGGTTNGATLSFLAGCPPIPTAGTITGPATACANSTGNVYTITALANATGYVWSVPTGATITAGTNTTSITVTFGTTSGNVSVYGTSSCTTGAPSSKAVTVNPSPTPTITGPATVCTGTTGNVYATQTGMTAYVWTVSAGGTITAGAGTASITVTWNTAGAQSVTATYTNASGCAAAAPTSYPVTVNARPTPTITGPANICQNTAGNVYTTQAGMTNYAWTVSAGGTITAGGTATSNTVTVTWTTSGAKTVGVNYTNAGGCAATTPASYAVTVNPLPMPTISGNASPCAGPQYVDYYTEGGNTGYAWTVSAGGTIYSGQGTSHLQVIWNMSGLESLSVNYTNSSGCTLPAPTTTNIFVNPVPAAAGTITGTATVCAGQQGVAYSTTSVMNATSYSWYLPAGATIASGAGTTSITVNFGAGTVSGNITVAGANQCGDGPLSPPFAVTVNPLPAAAGTITGADEVCQGETGVVYSVGTIANATGYAWTLPAGATITAGANTKQITVSFSASAASGVITVHGTNTCGDGANSPDFSVTVNPKPATPTITESGGTLTSSAASGNQWYFNGTAIPGATGQTYEATESGDYYVIVTLNGCSSDPSNTINVTMIGINPLSGTTFNIYPVPNDGKFTVTCGGLTVENVTLEVFNYLGVRIFNIKVQPVQGNVEQSIDLRPVPNGVYTVVLRTDDNRVIRRILVNK
ncbi:MAG: T9SS type A sorting domain-containing protein [Bacteroidales bacterium]|nr:T9SS type A sorting domain-containing protein [Bacteroidales bacterium]